MNKIWDFSNLSEYSYDNSKILVDSGIVSLRENLENVYARWHLNEATGATVLDTSGNGRDGTPVNNPISITGKLNNALSFDGINQYVNCGNITQFERTQSFSVEFWIKYTSTSIKAVVGNLSLAGTGKGWQIYTDGTKVGYQLRAGTTLNAVHLTFTDSLLNNGNWHHVVFTYNGNSLASGITCYIDNIIKSPTILRNALTASIISNEPLTIGQVNALYMVGSLDEVIIYDKELIQSEITFRYNSGNGKEIFNYSTIIPQPYAHYHLESIDTGDLVEDTSGNGRDGIAINSPSVVSGKLNNCFQFNGTTQYVNCGNIASFERTEDFSVECWFKTVVQNTQLVAKIDNDAPYRGWALYLLNDTIACQLTNTNSPANRIVVSGNTIGLDDNNWHHIVFTYDGSSSSNGVHLYVDNHDESLTIYQDTLSATIINSINCEIGAKDGAISVFDGLIDEVVIYEFELTSAQVSTRWNGGTGRENLGDYPTIEPTDLFDPATILSWDSFLEILGGENEGSIGYNLYKVDKANKYYWNGSVWISGGDSEHYNSQAVVNSNINAFDATPDKIGFIAYLISDGEQKIELDENQITYTANQVPLVNAGSNKACQDNQSIASFSDCTFSDPDGTIDYAYYKVDGEIDTWSEISQGGYGTLLEAVQAWTYQFDNIGIKTVRLQVEDNEGAKSEDSLEVTVSKYTVIFNVQNTIGTHVSDFYFLPGDGSLPLLKNSPFTYDYDYKITPYDTAFYKDDYVSTSAEVDSTDHTENIILTEPIYEETSRIYHPIRIDVKNKKSIIKTLVKGDTILFECKVEIDITDWKIRAELWDDITGGIDIEKATSNAGGSDFQIEVTDAVDGVFIIKINKGETTNIENTGWLEIELETNEGLIYTVYQSILRFVTEKIK